MTEQTLKHYEVVGMTCDHCRASVAEEVGEVEGVEDVAVDLQSGTLEIRGVGVSDEAVAAAVSEAGYSLAGGPR